MSSHVLQYYGVSKQTRSDTVVDQAVETIRLIGFAVVDGKYEANELAALSSTFDGTLAATHKAHGGSEELARIDEDNTIRLLLEKNPLFLNLALNPIVLSICRRLMGNYILLNQQNGIVNPPCAKSYNQSAYHRDLPYQHFVSSQPLMVNALFCLDSFTADNGATYVVPASHKIEDFPSDVIIESQQRHVVAPQGSFIIMDSMVFHRGGVNKTNLARRAINQAYSVPFIRQQIDLPTALGSLFTTDPEARKLLGYEVQTPTSVAAYYETRRIKLRPKD